jgi:heme exporter protein C
VAGKYEGGAFMQAMRSFALSAIAFSVTYAALIIAPQELKQGDIQRIFYVHVPSGMNALIAFTVACAASVYFLIKRNVKADWLASSCMEVGLAFGTVVLVTGPIWAKPAWGIYWTWDARLTSTFVLWVLGVCYLLLRRLIEDPERRSVVSAVFCIFAFLDAPLVYFSNRIFRTMHPQPVILGDSNSGLAPEIARIFLYCFIALAILMIALIRERYRLEELRHEVAEIRAESESV